VHCDCKLGGWGAALSAAANSSVYVATGHTGQCFDKGDRGNWADRWFHGTRVGTRVSKYPGINIPSNYFLNTYYVGRPDRSLVF